MNKYQEAIYKLWHTHFAQDIPEYAEDEEYADWQLMKELVLKATPIKVIYDGKIYSGCDKVQYICPKCKNIMLRTVCTKAHKPKYCYTCGQALDWSES